MNFSLFLYVGITLDGDGTNRDAHKVREEVSECQPSASDGDNRIKGFVMSEDGGGDFLREDMIVFPGNRKVLNPHTIVCAVRQYFVNPGDGCGLTDGLYPLTHALRNL